MLEVKEKRAVLYSSLPPTLEQYRRFVEFLNSKYGPGVVFSWAKEENRGFRLVVEDEEFDWSLDGRVKQFKEELIRLASSNTTVIPLLREAVNNWIPVAEVTNSPSN